MLQYLLSHPIFNIIHVFNIDFRNFANHGYKKIPKYKCRFSQRTRRRSALGGISYEEAYLWGEGGDLQAVNLWAIRHRAQGGKKICYATVEKNKFQVKFENATQLVLSGTPG